MTEFELVELINMTTSNVIANQALFVSILSAYLVVAYSVGHRLTVYQVAFINIIFIVFSLIGIQAVRGLLDFLVAYSNQLIELRGFTESQGLLQRNFVSWGMLIVRYVMCIGALIFMWQVRHPKIE